MTHPRLFKLAGAAGALGAIGVAIGISTSAAAPSSSAAHRSARGGPWRSHAFGVTGATGTTGPQGPLGGFHGFRGPGGAGGGAIHSVTVVPDPTGGFETVTIDSGTLKAVSGDKLTVIEGTTSATYATPTITVPSTVKVNLDGKASDVAALLPGDHLTISQSSTGTASVFATDAAFKPSFSRRPGSRGGHAPGGPGTGGPGTGVGPGGWGHGGPPPTGTTGASGVAAP
jgi:hypothetical protein